MSAPAEPVARMHRLAAALAAGECVDPTTAAFVVAAIEAFLNGAAPSLDDALGLRPAPGQASIATRLRKARRNRLIEEAAVRFFPGTSHNEAAERLALRLLRYRATGWRRDRTKDECPYPPATLTAALFAILKAEDRDVSARVIRRILAAGQVFSWPSDSAILDPEPRSIK